ncbi:MAG: hypothetical protein Greene07144_986 [Parcubacteria group bacterium Greene0714_4]|nr:MAG: hypothetical protein Greene07144_986 [Parcubacteria group bacterium Greene0714_4]
MDMEITLSDEKNLIAASLIQEYFVTWNENPVLIAVGDFIERGIKLPDISLVLIRLKGIGVVQKFSVCWLTRTDKKGDGSWVYEITSESEPIWADDPSMSNFEQQGYKITIDPQKLSEQLKSNTIRPTYRVKSKSQVIKLYLNKDGDLYRDDKKKFCYPIVAGSNRFKIVRYLAQNPGFQKTSDISAELEGKNEQSIRTEIRKIRENIKEFLKIDGKEVISAGRKGSGYSLSPNCKIFLIGF